MVKVGIKKLDLKHSEFSIISMDVKGLNPVWYDKATAQLLSCIEKFYDDVLLARNQLGIRWVALPQEEGILDLEKLFGLRNTFAKQLLGKLEKKAELLALKYRLTHRWKLSIQFLIVTDVLPLPISSPVYVKLPSEPGSILYEVGDALASDVGDRVDSKANLQIIVTENMTMTELVGLIKSNHQVRRGLDLLPKRIKSKLKNEALVWGHHAWVVKEFVNPKMSWKEIYNYLENKTSEDVPSYPSLAVYYNRFIRAKSGFEI